MAKVYPFGKFKGTKIHRIFITLKMYKIFKM